MRLQKVYCGFLVTALLAGCNFSFGSKRIDTGKVESLIKSSLEGKLGDALEGQAVVVKCPGDMPIKQGETFDCAVTVGERTLTAKVKQEDDKGTVAWEITDGLIEFTIGPGTEGLIRQYIAKNLGVADADVKCPDSIEVKTGGTFECTATIDGVPVKAGVEQQNEDGNVSYRLIDGVVLTEKLSIIVEAELKAQKVTAKVVCDAPILLSKPGSSFQCKATDANGNPATIEVQINDAHGDVNWKLVVPGANETAK